jgi:hypothetical protein
MMVYLVKGNLAVDGKKARTKVLAQIQGRGAVRVKDMTESY